MKEKLMKVVSLMLTFAITLLTGCSAFRPSTQMVNVTCNPNDAILTVNGQRYTPPVQITAKRNRDLSIQCYKDGYVPSQRTIGHHFNATGALDAVGTFLILVPGIGLFCPGAWSLDETDISMTLYAK
jgi:hypothetical protein